MLFNSNTKLENKFSKGESMQHEIYAADRTQVPVKNSVLLPRLQIFCFNNK